MLEITLDQIWCVIPVYNNAATVVKVANDCRKYVSRVLVIDDGSTDADISGLMRGSQVEVLRHECNLGKGAALKTALSYIRGQQGRFMITVDADGQHFAGDIPRFLEALDDQTLLVGARDFSVSNVPARSKFGRAFSNFWLRVETGAVLNDTQSGFRAYPVDMLERLPVPGNRYDFEAEVLTRASWAGFKLAGVPVGVWYPEPRERASSFRPFADNLRLTLLHARLVFRRLIPLPHRRLVKKAPLTGYTEFMRHPGMFMRALLKEHATPSGLAASTFVGVLFGVLPLVSMHTLVILYVASRLHLNKIMALAIQNICMPPFVPVACIELGHYMLYGTWLTEVSWQAVFGDIPGRLWEWFLGSLILAPLLAVLVSVIVFFASGRMQKKGLVFTDTRERRMVVRRRGNALGFWFFKVLVRFSGLRGAYILLYGVALHYVLFDPAARRGAFAYLRRRFPGVPEFRLFGRVYRLFVSQGRQLIDRYAAVSGAVKFDLRLDEPDTFKRLCAGEKGFVLLVSHMGNWQIAMTALAGIGRTVYLLMRPEDNRAVKENLEIDRKNARIKIISPEGYLGGVVEIVNALNAGGVVAIMGDRPYSFEALEVSFLGSRARFPYGAFVFAASSHCPAAVLFAAKTAHKSYRVRIPRVFEPVFEGRDKKKCLQRWLGEYAGLLEDFVREYPFQCFLFHDIWKKGE
ncbi:MAG: DUF2062 domain-containing protein [Candidatus Omnitrophica bacterium]|nr:DUF2062 domain-containing protein [Candidatus Omnitrophota bacterium]